MPKYRFILPVRAIGLCRLPDDGLVADGVTLTPAALPPAYIARLDDVQAESANIAYAYAQEHTEKLLCYLALLNESSAFVLDGREGVEACNSDLENNPTPDSWPAPPLETIGGVMTGAGQEFFASMLDPCGKKRRSGAILLNKTQVGFGFGQVRLDQICELFRQRDDVSPRIRIAVGLIHDAVCARKLENGFAHSFTALEVLTEHLQPSTVLDVYYQEARERGIGEELPYSTKKQLLSALLEFFKDAALSDGQGQRLRDYVSSARSKSQADIFYDYLTNFSIEVTHDQIRKWVKIPGRLVHAAEADEDQRDLMQKFREIVRSVVLQELRRSGT